MDRVKGVEPGREGWIARYLFRYVQKKIGSVPRSMKVIAHDTQTLLATSWMNAVAAKAKTVSPALKELVQLKAAVMVGCPF